MKIHRRFTRPGLDVFESVEWSRRSSRITNADGSLVFEMTDAEVPAEWSQLATDIMVSKYFRKAGVPQQDASGEVQRDENGDVITGPERSARQVIHRLAGCWRHWGEKHGYFDTEEDARAFYDELCHMLVHQMAAPNSPQWFNTGLNWAYDISGPSQGHWITNPETGEQELSSDAYTNPQPHACFIQAVSDDLVNEGGIMDLWTREARLFKYGSGTGTNFSQLRGETEPLSGGGKSSGLMSFLKIGDRAAGAIKSGGTTRRAAKMVCLDVDHPDIESFVTWKAREELKVASMVEGLRHLSPEQRELAKELELELDYDFNGEAYHTVSGQNANNSVRVSDAFLAAVEADDEWELTARTDGSVIRRISARALWEKISFTAWQCADPGVQYDSTINAWHTCPGSGRINASNPCSEYMFLDNTACNLASLNLLKFFDHRTGTFNVEEFEHAIEIWTMVLEISVLMAAFPSREIAAQSDRFRTLGLGFANLGAMLMQAGIPYDSDEGRAVCAAISAILTGRSYAASALLAAEHGPFAGYATNRDAMLRVVRNHRRAAYGVARDAGEWESLDIRPVPIDHALFIAGRIELSNANALLDRSQRCWDDALAWGERYGFRNAQTTVIAPTGTIGLLMDCDTTGVEPDFALVKFKKLAGGGYFKIANSSLRPALEALEYSTEEQDEIVRHVMGTLSLDVPMPSDEQSLAEIESGWTFRDFLESQDYTSDDIVALENSLPTVFELAFAFNAWSMPEHVLRKAGLDPDACREDASFNGLHVLGLSDAVIDELNRLVCGTQTVEGAPKLKSAHLPVFDCANPCGRTGERFIAPEGHIRMMAAAQPFISGAISKTINLPRDATVEDVASAYWLSWELGLKANALYRDGSKLSQPLSTRSDTDIDEDDEADDDVTAAIEEVAIDVVRASAVVTTPDGESTAVVERIVERIIERPMRRRLPDTRSSLTHRFNVAGHEGYLTVGLYDDGRPGELFITMSKEGSTIGGLMDSLGTAISVALQYGVPVESLVNKFAHQRFEPMGMTANRDIPFAKSLVDYIFRWMGMEFITGYREENAPRRSTPGLAKDTESQDRVKEDSRWSKQDGVASDARSKVVGGTGTMGTNGDASSDAIAPDHSGAPGGPEKIAVVDPQASASGRPVIDVVAESSSASMGVGAAGTETALDKLNAAMQTDAPACDVCGSITVRNGTCYKCMNCGNSMGCS